MRSYLLIRFLQENIMITQLHFLTTYMCTHWCEHCFVCSSPVAKGTFTPSQIAQVLDQAQEVGTIETIYFEGGEPFLFYPLLLEGIKEARDRGFSVGVVTNGYFATSNENARLFLESLKELDISDLSISDDIFHYEDRNDNPALRAFAVAEEMGFPASILGLEPEQPESNKTESPEDEKARILAGGGIMFRGRAAAILSPYVQLHDWQDFTSCPHEELASPKRLHVDSYGNLQICQGISIGNVWESPLRDLLKNYSATAHPICAPLVQGGPAQLARQFGYKPQSGVADACHLCFLARKYNIKKYPGLLCPDQVYCDD